jgi:DNA-binding GntR family transcriptional regulator
MGFDDKDFDKAQATGMSNTQLYKQAGNSIVVNVLAGILTNLNRNGYFYEENNRKERNEMAKSNKSLIEQVDELSEEQRETILRRINELQEKTISESRKEQADED